MSSKKFMGRLAAITTMLACLAASTASFAETSTCQLPRVLIVLDKSSSMITGIDSNGQEKWYSAKAAIETLVNTYSNKIDFGLMVYPNPNECNPGSVVVEVGKNTLSAISGFLAEPPPQTGNWTPMSQSLDVAATYQPLQQSGQRNYVLLVTDGWQWCFPYDINTRFDGVTSVQTLVSKNINTFVLGFGDGVDVENSSKMAVAGGMARDNCNASQTDQGASDLCYYQAQSQQDLEAAFNEMATNVSQESCDGLDNDCDGFTDNQTPGSATPMTKTVTTDCGSCTSTCTNGQWTACGTAASTCDDNNACTTDSCDATAGCIHVNNQNSCDDKNPCTTNDTCGSGLCIGTVIPNCINVDCQKLNCDDQNPCTDDSCDPTSGCKHVNNTKPCNDNDVCTSNDACSAGVCQGTAVNCDDSNPCTDDYCSKDACPSGSDDSCNTATGCRHMPNSEPCDDGNTCTQNDICFSGQCTGGTDTCNQGDSGNADCGCASNSTPHSFLWILGLIAALQLLRTRKAA